MTAPAGGCFKQRPDEISTVTQTLATIGATAGKFSGLAEVCWRLDGMIGISQVKASSASVLQSFCVQSAADPCPSVSPRSALAEH